MTVWTCTSSECADVRRLLRANHNILTQMTHSLHIFPCNFVCICPLKLNNKLCKITKYTRYRRLCMWLSAQPWNARAPIGLKRRATYTFCDDATMTRLSKWHFVNCPEMRAKVLDRCAAAHCRRDALMWSRFERVKERRRGPAELLTLFSNDWFNLLICVDLFTHITYSLCWINVCRNFPHYKLKSCRDE